MRDKLETPHNKGPPPGPKAPGRVEAPRRLRWRRSTWGPFRRRTSSCGSWASWRRRHGRGWGSSLPSTGKLEKDLGAARIAIDAYGALVEVLRPKLEDARRREIESVLTTLRLNYVEKASPGLRELYPVLWSLKAPLRHITHMLSASFYPHCPQVDRTEFTDCVSGGGVLHMRLEAQAFRRE